MDFETTKCVICGSEAQELISSKGQFDLPTNVVVCNGCGFSYLNPRWTKERYHQFYSKEYDTYYRPEVYAAESDEQKYFAVKTILKRLKADNLLPDRPRKIIDIGAGMGFSLLYLKNNFFPDSEYFAIESSEHCINHLRQNNIKTITHDVDSSWEREHTGTFDIVIMRHVLEHFLSPIDVLKKVSSVLKPGGIAYIAVPNSMRPKRPMLSSYFRVVHVSYFSKISLTNAFALSGLKPVALHEGDALDPYELFAVCRPSPESGNLVFSTENFLRQRKIYKQNIRLEPYYNFKKLIWRLIGLVKK